MPRAIGKGRGKRNREIWIYWKKSTKTMSWSLLRCMDNLGIQSALLLKTAEYGFQDDWGKQVLSLATRISTVYEDLKTKLSKQQRRAMKPSTDPGSLWTEYHAANRVQYTNNVLVSMMPRMRAEAQQMRASPRDRIRKFTMELVDMSTSLPEGIFLPSSRRTARCYEMHYRWARGNSILRRAFWVCICRCALTGLG